jgi:hypothetical protein
MGILRNVTAGWPGGRRMASGKVPGLGRGDLPGDAARGDVPAMWRALIPVLALSACMAAPPPDRCGASALMALVGSPLPLSFTPPPGTRIIRPGDAVTEDFSEQRLNVYLDSQGTVVDLTCG